MVFRVLIKALIKVLIKVLIKSLLRSLLRLHSRATDAIFWEPNGALLDSILAKFGLDWRSIKGV